ncbi:MAG: hypothetical protein GC181_11860 [Bacteroidetes bacterium]|nr:hypothetical protein [Bacteroidota bacterium]
MHLRICTIILLFAPFYKVFGQDEDVKCKCRYYREFAKPGFVFSTNRTFPSVYDDSGSGAEYIIYGVEGGNNFCLVNRRRINISFETVIGEGINYYPHKNLSHRKTLNAYWADCSMIGRYNIGQFYLGFGWVTGFVWVRKDYFYSAHMGLSGRTAFL